MKPSSIIFHQSSTHKCSTNEKLFLEVNIIRFTLGCILNVPWVTITVGISIPGLCYSNLWGKNNNWPITAGTYRVIHRSFEDNVESNVQLQCYSQPQCIVIPFFWCTTIVQTTCLICCRKESLQWYYDIVCGLIYINYI